MEGWRQRLIEPQPEEPQGLPLFKSILLRVTGSGARALTSHAERMGVKREQWIRDAIMEKMAREGAVDVPEMSPYRGDRLLREVTW